MKRSSISLPRLVVCAAIAASAASGAFAQKATELRVFWWGSQVRHDRTLKVLDMYHAANPKVTFAPEYTGGGQYFEKLNTLIAASDVPDVVQIGNNFLTYKDSLAPLDDFIKDGTIDIKNTNASFLSSSKVGGKILGISLGTNSMALVYDPALFKKAGVAEPTDTWTWDDLEKASAAFKSKLGIYGVNGMDDWSMGGWYYVGQNSPTQSILNSDGSAVGYSDDKFLENWFEMKKRFVKQGLHPNPAEAASVKDVQGEFIVSGKAAMAFVWSNQVAAMFAAANRPLKLALVPKIRATDPSGMYIRASQHFSVSKDSKNKAEAAKVINYIVGDVEANKVLLGERGTPIMSNVRDAIKPLVDPTVAQALEFMDKVGRVASKNMPVEPPAQSEIETLMRNLGEQVVYEKLSPATAAAQFRAEGTKILSRK